MTRSTYEEKATDFLCASFLSSYPPVDFRDVLRQFIESSPSQAFDFVLRDLDSSFGDESAVDEIRSRHINLFDRGRSENPLYESEYGQGRAFSKGGELVDIAGFYKAFGFAHGSEGSVIEMLDHIAVELEFYALMLLKESALHAQKNDEGQDIVFQGRCQFMKDHLGRFARVIAQRPNVVSDPYFGKVFDAIATIVEDECELLGISPERPDFYASDSEEEQMLCGATNHFKENPPNLVQIR